ncbi:hypothetical protein [Salisediminibacterium selenitireducens]|uniref:Uncharacterized protein n=1 Tax=Bacillus selenitireducens (strain ATCC 700615 / DSM 15326 / MLS10) TaxID=439292 RepID=D6XXL4_BACIE|nr:hypothetical protein [Salisediminibacterium selenitireducens]ADI00057.1 hypothetical protein Bsel_2556 [[Bacillus] selenitireducens MLS10]
MSFLNNLSKNKRNEYMIVGAILSLSVIIGIIVGNTEAFVAPRNFTAGYMAGSLTSALVLFAVYHTILFFKNKKQTTA